jgi:signal transduction histidine kinase
MAEPRPVVDAPDEALTNDRRIRVAVETSGCGAHDFDVQAGVVTWSPELYSIMGVSPGTPITADTVAATIHSDDRVRIQDAMAAALDPRGSGEFAEQFRIVRRDTGEIRWVYNRCRTLFVELNGKRIPSQNTGILLDVTERALREQRLADALHQIEIFIGVLGHDLRTPLGAIINSAEIALETATDLQMHRHLSRIARSGNRMRRMIDQLLDVTRLRVGRGIELSRRPVLVDQLCDRAIAELKAIHPIAPVALRVAGDCRIVCDADRVEQVVTNLVGNAIEHSPEGSAISVTADGLAPDLVVVTVHNAGAIDRSILPTLFEPFTRGPSTRAPEDGLGLGLFIAREIATAHGGSVTVRSGSDEGTSFEVSLPRRWSPALR